MAPDGHDGRGGRRGRTGEFEGSNLRMEGTGRPALAHDSGEQLTDGQGEGSVGPAAPSSLRTGPATGSGLGDQALADLVRRASETAPGPARMAAVQALKQTPVRQQTAHILCDCVGEGEHPAWRATAAQVLGYHRAAVRFEELQGALLEHARGEADPLVVKAIVFALRDTEATIPLLDHPDVTVVTEAVLGIPLSDAGYSAILDLFLRGAGAAVEALILKRLGESDGAPEKVVSFLLTAELGDGDGESAPRISRVFGALPQGALFEALTGAGEELNRTYRDIWPGLRRRERKRELMESFEDRLRRDGASGPLVDALVRAIACEDAFLEAHFRFIRSLFCVLDPEAARATVSCAVRVAGGTSREGMTRLAEALVALARAVPSVLPDVQQALAAWEVKLPGVQLRTLSVRGPAG